MTNQIVASKPPTKAGQPPNPQTRSPATSGKVNRAKKQSGRASTNLLVSDYHTLVSRVENDPDAHALAVYIGRERLGSILELNQTCHAFGMLDEPLGTYRKRRDASQAIYRAFERRQARPLAS